MDNLLRNKVNFACLLLAIGLWCLCIQSQPVPTVKQVNRWESTWQAGDEDQISLLMWSPDDSQILTSSEGALRLWDVKTGQMIWRTHIGFLQDNLELYWIRKAAWTQDQGKIVTGSDNGKLQLWDAASGKLIWNIKAHPTAIGTIAISPDGMHLLTEAEGEEMSTDIKLWRLSDGMLVKAFRANKATIEAIRFTDSNHFLTGDRSGRIAKWSTNESIPKTIRFVRPCNVRGQQKAIVLYSPTLSFAAAQCQHGFVIVDARTGQKVRRVPGSDKDRKIPIFSGDEKTIFLTDSLRTAIYGLDGKEVERLGESDGGVLNRDGSLIASYPSYRADGVQIFDTRTGKQQQWLIGHPGAILSLAFSPDGNRFASGSEDRVVRLWDTKTKTILLSLYGHTRGADFLRFSSDGRTLTSQSEKEIIVWNLETGKQVSERRGEWNFEKQRKKDTSPSGKIAIVVEYEKPIRLLDTQTGRVLREFPSVDQLDSLIFCPDEKHVLIKPWWSGWQMWNLESGQPVHEFFIGYSFYNQVAFHPDGRTFITGGRGQNLFMLDLESGEVIWSLLTVDVQEFEERRQQEARRVAFIKKKTEAAKAADLVNESYKSQVFVTFEHYGSMTEPSELRLMESAIPKKSKMKGNQAIWLRLHNNSPLPIEIPTQSMYLPNLKCLYPLSNGRKLFALCDGSEIAVWHGLEDADGNSVPYGYDFGSSALLLPNTSALFPVPRQLLTDGFVIRFTFTFKKESESQELEDYGSANKVRVKNSDVPSLR